MRSWWSTPCVSRRGVSITCRTEPVQLRGPIESSPNYDKDGRRDLTREDSMFVGIDVAKAEPVNEFETPRGWGLLSDVV